MVLVSPFLSRIYQPTDFGKYAVFASTVGVLSVFSSLRYEIAIPLPREENAAWALARIAFGSALIVSAALLLSSPIWGATYLRAVGVRPENGWHAAVLFIPLGIVSTVAYQVSNFLVIRHKRHDLLAKGKVVQGSTTATSQVAFGYLALGSTGLIVGLIVGRMMAALFSLGRLRITYTAKADIMKAAKRFSRFPKLALPSGGLNALAVEMPMLLTSSIFGVSIAGYYALAQRVVVTPLSMIGKSIAQVYMSTLGEKVRERDPVALSLFSGVAKRLLLLATPIFVVMAIAAPPFFKIVFGDKWYAAGEILRILSPSFLAQFVVVPLSQTLNFIGRQEYQLAWDVFRFSGVIASFALVRILGYGYVYAFCALSVFMVVAYGVLYYVMYNNLRRTTNSWMPNSEV